LIIIPKKIRKMNYEDLKILDELREKGSITEEEYQREKEKILNNTSIGSGKRPLFGMTENTYIMLMHLSQFAGVIVPCAGFIVPIIMWIANKDINVNVDLHGKNILNFMISYVIYAAVRTYWSPEAIERISGWKPDGILENGAIFLKNSGSCTLDGTGQQTDSEGNPVMKPFWEISDEEVEKMLDATTWYPASLEYMRGGGFSSQFITKANMPVTMSRINIVKGLGPVLQIAEGWTATLPEEVFKLIDGRTDKTWPSTFFVPRITGNGRFKDVYSVMNYWGANHAAISYGHIGADLITLASSLSIPVNMHNVEDEKIFRPSAWSAFGSDNEGADYRACANYGPLYR
jgi:hypothetical protein